MKQIFLGLLVATALAAGMVSPASAKTPPEVLTPYKAYRAALQNDDYATAIIHAEAAYTAALEHKSDAAALIAPLAQNFADLLDDPKRRVELYRAAIEATPTDTPENIEMGAERWVLLAQAQMLRDQSKRRTFNQARKDIDAGWKFIQWAGLEDTTFGGEIMVAKGWAAAGNGKEDKALEWYDRADTVFSGPNHTYFSVLEYSNKLLRGKTLLAYDRDIEAALSLQEVMQNSEGQLPAEHPYIQDAFQSWV
ncbi:MAG: hypothetical protein WBG08_09960 [Litorimonas sp.]